jgi:phytoene dehydrogenase-like protein
VPPQLDEVRRDVAGTAAEPVLERALTTTLRQVQDAYLPTAMLRDRYAHEGQMIGSFVDRDPLALTLAYWSMDDPDSDTGEKTPSSWVRGGMGNLTKLMAEAVREAGATIHLDSPVEQLLVEGGRVVGLRLAGGGDVRSRVVLSNLDPKTTFRRLLPGDAVAPTFRQRVEGLVTQVSSYKFLLALTELPRWKQWDGGESPTETVALHRARAAVATAYQDLAAGQPPRTPMINVSTPSQVDPSLAPPGYHTASIWVYPAPSTLQGEGWDGIDPAWWLFRAFDTGGKVTTAVPSSGRSAMVSSVRVVCQSATPPRARS